MRAKEGGNHGGSWRHQLWLSVNLAQDQWSNPTREGESALQQVFHLVYTGGKEAANVSANLRKRPDYSSRHSARFKETGPEPPNALGFQPLLHEEG